MLTPLAGLIQWLAMVTVAIVGVVAFARLLARAVRALERRSSASDDVLLLAARVAEQEREIAELRRAVERSHTLPGSANRDT